MLLLIASRYIGPSPSIIWHNNGGGVRWRRKEEGEEEEVAILSPPPPMVSSTFIGFMNFTSMSGKDRRLVTNEPVEFGE